MTYTLFISATNYRDPNPKRRLVFSSVSVDPVELGRDLKLIENRLNNALADPYKLAPNARINEFTLAVEA